MTLFLWDASDYDWSRGPMDLHAAKADGIVGFTHKATEATWIKHVHTGEALSRALDAGMEFIGAYHVVRSTSPAEQVDYFLTYLDQVAPWWRAFPGFFLQVDLEVWSYDQVTAATGMAFAAALVDAQPKKVITYASRGQYGGSLAGIATPLWNAAYGTNPVAHYPDAYRGDGSANWSPYSGQEPVFWQYGSQLTIGTQPGADCSAFRGSLDDLRALMGVDDMTPEQARQLANTANLTYEALVLGHDTMSAAIVMGDGSNTFPAIALIQRLNAIEARLAALEAPTGDGTGPTAAEIAKAVNDDAAARLAQ